MRIVGAIGPACRNWTRRRAEGEVQAAVVGILLGVGWEAASLRYEYRLSPRSRVDVAAVSTEEIVLVECKRSVPTPADIRQVRRYVEDACAALPQLEVRAFIAYPSTGRLPTKASDIALLEAA